MESMNEEAAGMKAQMKKEGWNETDFEDNIIRKTEYERGIVSELQLQITMVAPLRVG